jgi:hypothetical protein
MAAAGSLGEPPVARVTSSPIGLLGCHGAWPGAPARPPAAGRARRGVLESQRACDHACLVHVSCAHFVPRACTAEARPSEGSCPCTRAAPFSALEIKVTGSLRPLPRRLWGRGVLAHKLPGPFASLAERRVRESARFLAVTRASVHAELTRTVRDSEDLRLTLASPPARGGSVLRVQLAAVSAYKPRREVLLCTQLFLCVSRKGGKKDSEATGEDDLDFDTSLVHSRLRVRGVTLGDLAHVTCLGQYHSTVMAIWPCVLSIDPSFGMSL